SCAGLETLPARIAPELIETIRAALAERRLAPAAVSGTFNLIHPEAWVREEGLRRLPVLASACRSLGAPVITLCTGTRDRENMWRRHPDNDLPQAWDDLIASLSRALEIAANYNVILGIEPEAANVVDSAPKARRLLDEMRSPHLKIVL